MLIINTVEAARELLEKRSFISSNRPHLVGPINITLMCNLMALR